jgi:uncharacterized CHY-type Zn-finger protein
MRREIHNVSVSGIAVDAETRCAHYHGRSDVIALKFRCCGEWFSCFECHSQFAKHTVQVWPPADFDARAVLCGGCGHQLTVREYLDCGSACPQCRREFNPGCANHNHLYFAT